MEYGVWSMEFGFNPCCIGLGLQTQIPLGRAELH